MPNTSRTSEPPFGLPFRLNISIAGMPTRLSFFGLTEEKQRHLQDWYAAFSFQADPEVVQQDAEQPETVLIEARVEPGEVFLPFKPGPWQVRTYQRGEQIEFVSHQEKGWYKPAEKRGELILRPGGNPENYLRVIYAWRCLARNALLVHASGVLRKGGGYVFFGPSGSGKTTTARLSPDVIILSDDLVILRCEPAESPTGVRVYGVPFRGEMIEARRTNVSAPLVGLYTLVKDSAHWLADLGHTEATARLAACVPFVMSQPENAGRVLELCAEISRLVRVKALHFQRDAGFWRVIDG